MINFIIIIIFTNSEHIISSLNPVNLHTFCFHRIMIHTPWPAAPYFLFFFCMENELYTIYSSWFFSLLYFCRLLLYFVSFIITFSRIYLGGTWKRSSPHLPQFFFCRPPFGVIHSKENKDPCTQELQTWLFSLPLFSYYFLSLSLLEPTTRFPHPLYNGRWSSVQRWTIPKSNSLLTANQPNQTFYRAVRGEKIVIPVCTLNIVHKVWVFGKCFRWCWQMWLKYATV